MAITATAIKTPVGTAAAQQTFTNTFDGSANIGDLVVIFLLISGASTSQNPTDSVGNKYSACHSQISWSTTNAGRISAYATKVSVPIVAASTTYAITSTGTPFWATSATKFVDDQNIWMNPPINKAGQSASQSTATPVTGTTGRLSSLHQLCIAQYGWGATRTFTEPTGWTNPQGAGVKASTTNTIFEFACCYKEITDGSAQNPQATLDTTINSAAGGITSLFIGSGTTVLNNYQFGRAGDGMSGTERIR